jgi:hypothetical protein
MSNPFKIRDYKILKTKTEKALKMAFPTKTIKFSLKQNSEFPKSKMISLNKVQNKRPSKNNKPSQKLFKNKPPRYQHPRTKKNKFQSTKNDIVDDV